MSQGKQVAMQDNRLCIRQRREPVEALQGLQVEMEAAGTNPVCLGPTCKRPAEAAPGGTTRLAQTQVEPDGAADTNTPGLDVVLSECAQSLHPLGQNINN